MYEQLSEEMIIKLEEVKNDLENNPNFKEILLSLLEENCEVNKIKVYRFYLNTRHLSHTTIKRIRDTLNKFGFRILRWSATPLKTEEQLNQLEIDLVTNH